MEILAYIGAVLLLVQGIVIKKRNTSIEALLDGYIEKITEINELYTREEELEDELQEEKESNRSLKGWSTKHQAIIDKLEEKNNDQADTIKRLLKKDEEVSVALEAILVAKNKKEMKEIINKLQFND